MGKFCLLDHSWLRVAGTNPVNAVLNQAEQHHHTDRTDEWVRR